MSTVNSPKEETRKRHVVGGADLGKDRGVEAKRLAAAILEVLAGARTPTEAATALGLSPSAAVVNKTGKKPRKRRVARALSVAERLKQETIPTTGTSTTSPSSEAV